MKQLRWVMVAFLGALAICSAGCRGAQTLPSPPPDTLEARGARFDPLATSPHLQDAEQALRALPDDVDLSLRANLHLRFAGTLHLLDSPSLASSYLAQVRQREPSLARSLELLEPELDAAIAPLQARYQEARSLDERRLIVAQLLAPVKHVDPATNSLLDVLLSYEELSQLTTSPFEALSLLEQRTRQVILHAEALAARGDREGALALLTEVDEEVFSHRVLGMDRWLRSRWIKVASRIDATELISTSMRRELPLYFDEQTPAAQRSSGLLLGCQLLVEAALHEDALRYCVAARKLLLKNGAAVNHNHTRYLSDQSGLDALAASGFSASMQLGRWEDADAFIALHEDPVWRATRLFEVFEEQVFEHLREPPAEERARLEGVDALMRFARERFGLEEQLTAALLMFRHTRGDPQWRGELDALLSMPDARGSLFLIAPGATLSLQLRAQALLVATAREVGFTHERLTLDAMARAREAQREELPEQEAYHELLIELELLDVKQRARGSDFSDAAQISERTLRMVDTIVLTDANHGLNVDVARIGERLQRAPVLLLAWLERLERAEYVVALLDQFAREGIALLGEVPTSKVKALVRILEALEVKDERARIALVDHLLAQLGHEPEVRAYAAAQIWRAWSLREVPLEVTLSSYRKWLELQMDSGVSVGELLDRTSQEAVDDASRRRANLEVLNRLYGALWLSEEVTPEVLTRLERQVVTGSAERFPVERAKLAALRARIGECDTHLEGALFEAFPPALPVVVRGCRDEVESGALHAWLMARSDEEARALRELVFELVYARKP